jgi:hypothetical protein
MTTKDTEAHDATPATGAVGSQVERGVRPAVDEHARSLSAQIAQLCLLASVCMGAAVAFGMFGSLEHVRAFMAKPLLAATLGDLSILLLLAALISGRK